MYQLIPHPDHPPLSASAVSVEVIVGDATLSLRYRVQDAESVIFPPTRPPERTDGLWKSTCFELFLRPVSQEAYHEFNFSPSTQWAAYAFDSHRSGMRDLACVTEPHITRVDTGVDVVCSLDAPPDCAIGMALTAVIEEDGARRSFWSLAHPPGPPDFHHHACFAAILPTVEVP